MEITLRVDDVLVWGYAIPYYLGYIRQKGSKVTMQEMIDDLGYSEPAIRQQLDAMARLGLIKKHYEHIKGKGGRAKLVGVEII